MNEENVIEFLKDEKTATLTLSQGRYISKIEKLAKERPEECEIVARNKNSSICAHVPVSWIKIKPTLVVPEERRKKMQEQFKRNVLNKRNNRGEKH